MTTPEQRQVIMARGFRKLREFCDPRGHHLLDTLEELARSEIALRDALVPLAFECNVDESAGLAEVYELGDHSRRVGA